MGFIPSLFDPVTRQRGSQRNSNIKPNATLNFLS